MIDVPPGAVWIGSPHPFDLHEAYIRFRKTIHLPGAPEKAVLSITADSRYRLWINGNSISRGPRRSYPHAQSIDEIDIAEHLVAGPNVLAVLVYQPGYSHFAYVHRGTAGMLGWLAIDDHLLLVTDETWRVSRDYSFSSAVPRVSIYGSGMEDRDLRAAEPWQQTGFDDSKWPGARVVAPTDGYLWSGLEPRQLPMLIEGERPLSLLLAKQTVGPETRIYAQGDVSAFTLHEALAEYWQSDERSVSMSQDKTNHETEWHRLNQRDGATSYWLFDLGRDYLCQGSAAIRGASGGETLIISYIEKMDGKGPLLSDPATYCRMRLTDRFTLRAGDQSVESFALRGGRYLLFAVQGETGAEIRFSCRAAGYPLVQSRHLAAEDPVLQDAITLCETTFRACLHDGFVDSVWRESSQWVGDALPQALIMHAMSDDVLPLRQAIRMAAQGVYPDGVLPGVVPGEVHAYTVVDYNFSWVELLSLYLEITSDVAFVLEHWQVLINLLDRFDRDVAEDGLIRSQPGRRLFLDWAPVSRQEPSAIYNLRYLLALAKAMQLAERLGIPEQAARWHARAKPLGRAIRRVFWRDGRWLDDPEGATYSQLATALAVLTGLAADSELPGLLESLVARSLDPDDAYQSEEMVLASPFMHHYVFEALRQEGRVADVVEIVRRRWGRWASDGWPTAWENWNVDFPDSSLCHAFSAHPRYHLWQIARSGQVAGLWEIDTVAE